MGDQALQYRPHAGSLQSYDGVTHVKAEDIRPLHCADLPEQASHDFH